MCVRTMAICIYCHVYYHPLCVCECVQYLLVTEGCLVFVIAADTPWVWYRGSVEVRGEAHIVVTRPTHVTPPAGVTRLQCYTVT